MEEKGNSKETFKALVVAGASIYRGGDLHEVDRTYRRAYSCNTYCFLSPKRLTYLL